MPCRTLIAEPEALAFVSDAFNAAWAEIERVEPIDPLARPAARERLGYIILGIWHADRDASIVALAVKAFRAGEASSAHRLDA